MHQEGQSGVLLVEARLLEDVDELCSNLGRNGGLENANSTTVVLALVEEGGEGRVQDDAREEEGLPTKRKTSYVIQAGDTASACRPGA